MLELCDLFAETLENEGVDRPCTALILGLCQGKTNKHGKIEAGACVRNKVVEICPVGALAMYLFWRWQVNLEPFPDFSSSSAWYDIKLLVGDRHSNTQQISYRTQHAAAVKGLAAIGVISRAKTHANRGSGARIADNLGIALDDIRRMGKWNSGLMESVYVTNLPRGFIRGMAGFEEKGMYYLPRASVDPPQGLKSLVFPSVSFAEHCQKYSMLT